MGYQVASTTITPNIGQVLRIPNSGARGYVISNQSGYELNVILEGSGISKYLFPGTADFFPYRYGFTGIVFLSTVTTLPNVLNYPGLTLSIELITKVEDFQSNAYPMSIAAVQAVSPTASGKNLFSVTVGFGATTTVQQQLNVFNPPTSGKTLTFHSARVASNNPAFPTANLTYKAGADLNFANSVSAVSHAGQANAPVSVTNCTYVDSATPPINTQIEVMNVGASIVQDFLAFPDKVDLFPGGNLTIVFDSATVTHVVRLTMKWSE